MSVTLSVPEILNDLLAAFKTETTELFGPDGFGHSFTSDTAVLGDKTTAHISHVPLTGNYDNTGGGFTTAAQDVTTLLEDVSVTLNQMPSVTIRIPWMTALATKGVELYRAAITNQAYALSKAFVDGILYQCVSGNVSNSFTVIPSLTNLDTFDAGLRAQCNSQRMAATGRWCYLNTQMATQLGADDRVRSKLFYGETNGDAGIRRWDNIAGFSRIAEYSDFPVGNGKVVGMAGDNRLVGACVRRVRSSASIARDLGIPIVLEAWPVRDKDTGFPMTGFGWQDQSGNVFVTVAFLCGTTVGNNGGGAGAQTDNAGCLLITP